MILFVLVAIRSCIVGIVSVATRELQGKCGNITLVILFGLAAFMGFVGTLFPVEYGFNVEIVSGNLAHCPFF